MLRGDVGTLDTTADATAGDLALAATAAQLRKDFGTAWSLWERALARPRLANAIAGEWEHSAATCALLAVRGPTATNEQRVRARGQARAWLQAFVDAESNALGGGSPRAHAALQRLMRSSDFESVRGEAALANLGAEEAAGWRAFWSTVAGIVRAEPTSSAEAEGRRD
jgi:hypothetical protein